MYRAARPQVLRVRTNALLLAQALPGTVPWSVITTYLADYLHVQQQLTDHAGRR